MATFEISVPGQGRYRISGVDSEDAALEALSAQLYTPSQAPTQAAAPAQQPAPEAPSGFLRGMRDPIDAAAQMLERVLPTGVTRRVNALNNWLVEQGVPLERLGEGGLQQQLTEQEAAYQQQRTAAGETGFDWGRLGGALASPANLAIASRLPAAASGAGRLAAGAGGGAVMGSLAQPLPETEDFWTEKAKQAGTGAALGGALSGIGQGIGYIGRQARRPEVAQLRQAGVQPTIGETIGGWASRAEEKLGSVPVLGDAIAAARRRAQEQFNNAAINKALEPLGVEIKGAGQAAVGEARRAVQSAYNATQGAQGPSGTAMIGPLGRRVEGAGQEAVNEAHKVVQGAYEKAATIVPGIRLDSVARTEISNLRGMLKSAQAETERDFGRFFRNTFQRKLGGAVGFETKNFKELDSLIGKRIASGTNQELKDAFRELQRILRAQAGRESPEYAAAQRAADEAYARLVRIEEAAKRAAMQEGVFTPGQLVSAARSADRSVRRNATARGEALMQDFATLGQKVLGNVVPNSGTVDRGLLAALAAAPFSPSVAASIGLGPLLYTQAGQNLLTGLARRAPNFTGTTGAAYGGLLGGMR
jgi:hypothetical protein